MRGGETHLVLASGRRDSGSRDLPVIIYTYNPRVGGFVERQRVPSMGTHDVEIVRIGRAAGRNHAEFGGAAAVMAGHERGREGTGVAAATSEASALFAVIAHGASWSATNPGDGERCEGDSVHVYVWDDADRQFSHYQALAVDGCTTFVRAWEVPAPAEGVLAAHGAVRRAHQGVSQQSTEDKMPGHALETDSGRTRILLAVAVERTLGTNGPAGTGDANASGSRNGQGRREQPIPKSTFSAEVAVFEWHTH